MYIIDNMYELIGLVAVLLVVFSRRFRLSHILFVTAAYNLSVAAIAWFNANIDGWFCGLGFAALSFTGVSVLEISYSSFLHESYQAMPRETVCCLPKFGCSSPDSILFLTCLFRAVAGLSASASFYVSWTFRKAFWHGHTTTVVGMWAGTSLVWLISCVPHFICLLQCASTTESRTIIRFRKRVTVWLVHDVVLGVFWMYLAFMLDHLLKEDDSEWRTVFLSMMSWHIIIFVCRKLYLTDVWHITKHVACCAPETVGRWAVVLMLSAMLTIYGVLVHVVRDSVDMGCSLEQVVVFVFALVVGCIGYLMAVTRRHHTKKNDVSSVSRNTGLQPTFGSLYALDF